MINAYSIFDDKASVYNTPFFSLNDAVAVRDFTRLVHDDTSLVHVAPRDFHLYRVGEFDDDCGIFMPSTSPVFVVHAVSCIKPIPLSANADVSFEGCAERATV